MPSVPTGPDVHRDPPRRGPLLAAGLVLGAGLGGFVDGIALHQIAQWHQMLSARLPPDTLVAAKTNMFWDGVFHAGVWLLTVGGLAMLWRATGRADVPRSGRALVGAMLAGWGLFNLVEGTINHQILGLHHVHEYAANRAAWDLGFLALGVALLVGGAWLARVRRPSAP